MHGFPHAVKDLTATKGIRTTQGSRIFKDFVPAADAIMVERLKAAGAIIIGKTNTPEFGLGSNTYNDVFGKTLNAYDQSEDRGRIERRRRCRARAAHAAGRRRLRPRRLAPQSRRLQQRVRLPPLLRPRAVARRRTCSMPGWACRARWRATCPTSRVLLSVQAGYDPRMPLSNRQDPAPFAQDLKRDFKGARIAWSGDFGGLMPFEPGVLDLCKSALKTFETLGCTVEEAWPDFPIERIFPTWLKLRAWQSGTQLKDLYNDPAKRALMKPEAQFEVESGAKLSAYEVYDASVVRTAWYQATRAFFENYDYFILPAGQVFPFDANVDWPKTIAGKTMDTYHRWMEVMIPVTMAAAAAIAVPAGFGANGLPMGLQIMGPNHGELALLQLANAYDEATRWVTKRPPPLARAESGRRALLSLAQNELQIAQIDEHAEALAQDEHRIAAVERIDEQQQARRRSRTTRTPAGSRSCRRARRRAIAPGSAW